MTCQIICYLICQVTQLGYRSHQLPSLWKETGSKCRPPAIVGYCGHREKVTHVWLWPSEITRHSYVTWQLHITIQCLPWEESRTRKMSASVFYHNSCSSLTSHRLEIFHSSCYLIFFKSRIYNAVLDRSVPWYRAKSYWGKHKWKSDYSQLIGIIWRKGEKRENEEEGSQRLLIDETMPTKPCSPCKHWRIAGQKRDSIYHSVFRFIHVIAAAVHSVNTSLEVAMTKTNRMGVSMLADYATQN